MNHKQNFVFLRQCHTILLLTLVFLPFLSQATNHKIDSLRSLIHSDKPFDEVFVYSELARLHIGSNYDSVLYYAMLSEASARTAENDTFIATSLLSQGTALRHMNKQGAALEKLQHGLDIARKLNWYKLSGNLLFTIGIVHSEMGAYDYGLRYFREVLTLYEGTGFTGGIVNTLSAIGSCHFLLNDYDSAMIYFQKTIEMVPDDYPVAYKANPMNNAASIYAMNKDFDKAIEAYLEVLRLWRKEGHRRGEAGTLSNLGNVFAETGRVAEAIEYLQQAYEMSKEYHLLSMIPQLMKNFALAYEKSGQYRKAFEFQQKYIEMNDSINTAEYREQLAEMEMKYKAAEKEHENELLKVELLTNQMIANKRATAIRLMVVGSALLVALIVLLLQLIKMRAKTHKQANALQQLKIAKAEEEKLKAQQRLAFEQQIAALEREAHEQAISMKNRELVTATMQIITRNKILGDVREMVADSDTETVQMKLDTEIKRTQHMEKDWHHFKAYFQQVHPVFFEKLHSEYPQLTDYELRLSAFLKTNLSTKEMAQLLRVTTAAINKSRQRLRRKLGIDGEESLYAFMNQY
jgi:tetratricopeptide (TPR) repeat protein